MYRKENGNVILTMTQEEYELLVTAIAFGTKHALTMGDGQVTMVFIKLMNSLNEGNPAYRPYEVPKQ